MIATDLSKQQALDNDLRAIQHIILLEIQIAYKKQQYLPFLKKQRKLFFRRNCNNAVNKVKRNTKFDFRLI